MTTIPIVFAFNDAYALPASIAISSLLENKKDSTKYEIFVFHNGLKTITKKRIEQIASVNWINVNNIQLPKVPIGWSGIETYYRLFIADILTQYDKVIWSDVDVLFKGDLSNIYNQSLDDYYWAGIIAENQIEPSGIHTRFKENTNEHIFMPGFMIVNAKKWREEHKLDDFFQIIKSYNKQLKMFDLDVLNLACNKIKAISFQYCVLENIFDNEDISKAPEYIWLVNVYGKDKLEFAKQNPIIIHYAGKPIKIWKRNIKEIPDYYFSYINRSPFYNPNMYFPSIKNKIWYKIKTINDFLFL